MKEKTYKCSFACCPYKDKIIQPEDLVENGKKKMHKECAKNSENMLKIKTLYYEKVSNTVVMSQLVKVIKDIITLKKVDSDYFYFALKYAVDNKMKINSPYGLHYLIDNNRIKMAWKEKRSAEIANEIKEQERNTIIQPNANTFNYSLEVSSGFGNILKGGQ